MTCHDRREKTLLCLDHLYASQVPIGFLFEVYLVDDGCTDGTQDNVRERYPNINILHGKGNLYWNRGMHCAWREAAKKEYDYYLWLNDDTNLYQNALQTMLASANATNSEAAICGTTVSPTNTREITYGGYWDEGKVLIPNNDLQGCRWFNGNCVLIPKHVFQLVGNLDFTFRHSLGDFDYGIRSRQKYIQLFVAPAVIGTCSAHYIDPCWRRLGVPLIDRFKSLYSPLGCNPVEFFTFDLRKSGIIIAICHFFSIHLRALVPSLWR